jgi:hypothetical protein
MKMLTQLPTADPRMRAYRLIDTAPGRAATIHEIVRQVAQSAGSITTNRSRQATAPWIATR